MYADAWRSSELIKHDPLSFSSVPGQRDRCPSVLQKGRRNKVLDEFFRVKQVRMKCSDTPGRNHYLQGCFGLCFNTQKSTESITKEKGH